MANSPNWLPSKYGLFYIAIAALLAIPILYDMHNWTAGILTAFVIIGGAYAGDYGLRRLKGKKNS